MSGEVGLFPQFRHGPREAGSPRVIRLISRPICEGSGSAGEPLLLEVSKFIFSITSAARDFIPHLQETKIVSQEKVQEGRPFLSWLA